MEPKANSARTEMLATPGGAGNDGAEEKEREDSLEGYEGDCEASCEFVRKDSVQVEHFSAALGWALLTPNRSLMPVLEQPPPLAGSLRVLTVPTPTPHW